MITTYVYETAVTCTRHVDRYESKRLDDHMRICYACMGLNNPMCQECTVRRSRHHNINIVLQFF